MGWTLVDPSYRDIGSASKHATKVREGFERLLDDLRKDKFPGQLLMMWENNRGSRQEEEWLDLINLAALRNVRFWIEIRSRIMDPKDPHDRRDLVHAAADAAFETGLMSNRIRRGTSGAAVSGLPHGPVPYGFRRVYDNKTGKFVAQVHDVKESFVVLELFERVSAGHSIYRITRDFEQRGIEKRSGGPFHESHLRSMLTNAAYAGVRIHDPDRVGRRVAGHGAEYPAVWDAIVDLKVFTRVQKILNDPDRVYSRPGAAKYFLSNIARCICAKHLGPATARGGLPRYRCAAPSACSQVGRPELDGWTTRLMMRWLSDPDCYHVLGQASDEQNAQLQVVRAKLVEVMSERDDLSARAGAGEEGLTVAFVVPLAAGFERRIQELRAEERRLQPSVLDGLLEPGPDVAERWEALKLDTRRLVARRLLVPRYIGELRIKPVGRGNRNVPVKDRVVVDQH